MPHGSRNLSPPGRIAFRGSVRVPRNSVSVHPSSARGDELDGLRLRPPKLRSRRPGRSPRGAKNSHPGSRFKVSPQIPVTQPCIPLCIPLGRSRLDAPVRRRIENLGKRDGWSPPGNARSLFDTVGAVGWKPLRTTTPELFRVGSLSLIPNRPQWSCRTGSSTLRHRQCVGPESRVAGPRDHR
jgi:hypothetical protein